MKQLLLMNFEMRQNVAFTLTKKGRGGGLPDLNGEIYELLKGK